MGEAAAPITFDPDRLYRDLVEVEALAVTADVTMLPPNPSGKKHRQTLARLYTLVGQTSVVALLLHGGTHPSKANAALELSQELVALTMPVERVGRADQNCAADPGNASL